MTGGYTMKEKNIQELAKRMGLITVENMCQYTIAQLVVMVANKVNELVDEVWRFETDVQEILKTQNEKIQHLLGEGLYSEVESIFDGWLHDGTFSTLINQTALKKVNDRIDETKSQLSVKIQEVASTGTTTEVLKSTTEKYIKEKLDDGTIANLTIENASVTRNKLAFPFLSHLSVSNKNMVIEVIGNSEIIVKFQPTTMWLTDNNFKTIKAIDIEECQFVVNLYGMLGWDLNSNTLNVYPYNYEVTHSNIYPLVFFDSQGMVSGEVIDFINVKQCKQDIVDLSDKVDDVMNMVAYAPVGSRLEIHYDTTSKKVYYYCTNLRIKTRNFNKYYSFDNIKELFPEQVELYNGEEFLAINDGDCLTFNDKTGSLEITGWLEEVSTHHFRLIYNLSPNNIHGYLVSYYISQSIKSINQSISDLKNTVSQSGVLIPPYFEEHINNKIKAVNLDLEESGKDGFAINVIGDMHYQTNSKNTHSLIKYITPQINAKLTVALGDYINNDKNTNNLRTEYTEILKHFEGVDMIGCLGNHDDNSIYNQMQYVFDNRVLYNYINRKFEDSVVFGGDFYYYRDDNKNKIRYIVLDTQDTGNPINTGDGTITTPRQHTRIISQEQINWFSNVALNISDEWGVIVIAHHNLFSEGIVGTESNVINGQSIWNRLVQFKNEGGTVICWINGHVHYDNLIKRDGINIVTVLNNDTSVWSTAPKKIKGTTSELAFDIAVVNKHSRTVKLHRVGAGDDRQFSY